MLLQAVFPRADCIKECFIDCLATVKKVKNTNCFRAPYGIPYSTVAGLRAGNIETFLTISARKDSLYEYEHGYCRSRETLKHIFQQKNGIKFETRITRQETIRHDSVCYVMRFRMFTDTLDKNPWFFILALFCTNGDSGTVLYATVLY